MISRLRLAARVGGVTRLLEHARPSLPATTRLMCQVPQKQEETSPEFGQIFKDISAMLKAKTGETGKTLLVGGLLTYVLSKEILVLHDETVLALVMGGTLWWVASKVGKPVADMLDARRQGILDMFNEGRNNTIKSITKAIEDEKQIEVMLGAKTDIVEVMRENNAMSIELEYRSRLHEVVREVKKRLDYQADMEAYQRRAEQEHIVDWVESEVVKSISPQLEKDSVSQCIRDLKAMAPA